MQHTYTQLITHAVFSTHDRRPTIQPLYRNQLHAYTDGILKNIGIHPLCTGGTADHVHVLMSASPQISTADALRLIKCNSSKWLRETHAADFAWQRGYGAFSVSMSNVDATRRYIAAQESHHARRSFDDEWLELLRKHGVSPADAGFDDLMTRR